MAKKNARENKLSTLGENVRVAIYVRRSTDDEHQPYSIEAQDTRLTSYINSQPGWKQVKRFHDDASGASTERTGLHQALSAAKAGLFEVLLVYRVDRFSRNLGDMVNLLDELDKAGVVFRSATEPFDTSTPMGRMLVQMLGMFAQFERDTIIDRVIAGMERKAANGKWKGGRRPFGYLVDKQSASLVPEPSEATVVRTVFNLYAIKRKGSSSIAKLLNARGHRTTTGGRWSTYQVLRILSNRIYLGELTFREITSTDCHPPIVEEEVFNEAQRILGSRMKSHVHRSKNDSDYQLTGLMRCPKCGRSMIGARAHGRAQTYRYYICFNRARYDANKCDSYRINADAVEEALLDSLVSFYRDQHELIADAVDSARTMHLAASSGQKAELKIIEADIAKTKRAIERYLSAFENGTLDDQLLGERLNELKLKLAQLHFRRNELTSQIEVVPSPPPLDTLLGLANHVAEIIEGGDPSQAKALIEELVKEIKILANDTIVPIFRIPQQQALESNSTTSEGAVRAMTNLVTPAGFEPAISALRGLCPRPLDDGANSIESQDTGKLGA